MGVDSYQDKIVALDLGFGWTKAKKGENYFRQPSVVGESRTVHEDYIKDTDITYGKNQYFVGKLAIRHSNVRYTTLSDNKAEAWTSKILARCALAELCPDEEVFLITGLPLDFYFKQKTHMEKFLDDFRSNQDYAVTFGRSKPIKCRPAVKYSKIVPQPLGAGMHYLLNDSGELNDQSEANRIIVVADIGFHTFDLLVLDSMEIHRYSHSDTEVSVANSYKMIQEALRDKVGKSPDIYQLDAYVLYGSYQGYDLEPLISKCFHSLANQIDLAIRSLNLKFHKLILTGGWASQVLNYLPSKTNDVVCYDQHGNIFGYEKIARRICLTSSHSDSE